MKWVIVLSILIIIIIMVYYLRSTSKRKVSFNEQVTVIEVDTLQPITNEDVRVYHRPLKK